MSEYKATTPTSMPVFIQSVSMYNGATADLRIGELPMQNIIKGKREVSPSFAVAFPLKVFAASRRDS